MGDVGRPAAVPYHGGHPHTAYLRLACFPAAFPLLPEHRRRQRQPSCTRPSFSTSSPSPSRSKRRPASRLPTVSTVWWPASGTLASSDGGGRGAREAHRRGRGPTISDAARGSVIGAAPG